MKRILDSIKERNIPEILPASFNFKNGVASFEEKKKKIIKMLEENEYGVMPKKPEHLSVEIVSVDEIFCAGKATLTNLKFTVTLENGEFSFPVVSVIPKSQNKVPAFVHIAFRDAVPDKYMASEEIVDSGFAVFSFCYKDITSDDVNFRNGLSKLLSPKRRGMTAPGKIAMWAWTAMRVMDYVETLDTIDTDNVAVIGHSRLGKTALLTGAYDNRFKYVISNDSGCSGAAVTRGKGGENIASIITNFPHWFCPRYKKYASNEDALPYDQHFLLAASLPRHVLIGSAEKDHWADPKSEFISAYLAGEVCEKIYGVPGLVHGGKTPIEPCVLNEGRIHYHMRLGYHYLSREDWNNYIQYIKMHMENK